jgi:hypothetical protein
MNQIAKLLAGRVVAEHRDLDDRLKAIHEFPNGIVDEGLDHILDTQFNGGTPITTWLIGLVDNSGFSEFADADVLSSHAGWSESTTYTEANRVTWQSDAASSRAVSNSTTADFSINATGNLKGIFVSSNNVKSTGNTGTLWSTAAFSSVVATANGDTLKVTYTVSG